MSFVRRKLDHVFKQQWIPQPTTWWGRLKMWRAKRTLLKAWHSLPPHEQLANFIDILDRKPEFRQAFRNAIGIGNVKKANERGRSVAAQLGR